MNPIETREKENRMTQNILMKALRESYDVVDIEKIQGEIRLLNANLLNALNTLNRVLNEKDKLQTELKIKDNAIAKLQVKLEELETALYDLHEEM